MNYSWINSRLWFPCSCIFISLTLIPLHDNHSFYYTMYFSSQVPPAKLVAWLSPIMAWYWRHYSHSEKLPITKLLHWPPHRVAVLFAAFCWLTRKRVNIFFHAYLFCNLIFLKLILYILCNFSFISSNCINIISSTLKNADFHIYILNLQIYQISLNCSSHWVFPWT